jgi:hypothetical protein
METVAVDLTVRITARRDASASQRAQENFDSSMFSVGRHSFATHSIANLPLPARLDWHPIGRASGIMAEEWGAKE